MKFSRRRFLRGLAGAAVVAGIGGVCPSWAGVGSSVIIEGNPLAECNLGLRSDLPYMQIHAHCRNGSP